MSYFIITNRLIHLHNIFQYTFSPVNRDDFNSFVTRVRLLQNEFQRYNLLVGSMIPYKTSKTTKIELYNYAALSNCLNFIGIYGDFLEPGVNGLNVLNIMNLKKMLAKMITLGVPASKLVMVLNFEGNELFRTEKVNAVQNVPITYSEICKIYKDDGGLNWEIFYDADASLAYLKKKHKTNKMADVVFQNPRSIVNRVRLAMRLNLVGVTIHVINSDDVYGKCHIDEDTFDDFKSSAPLSITTENRPLLRIINDAIQIALIKKPAINQIDDVEINAASGHMCNAYMVFVLLGLYCISLSSITLNWLL